MKNGMKLLFGLALVGLTYTACSDDDDDDTKPATTTTNNNGGGNNNPTAVRDTVDGVVYTQIGTDVNSDATTGGLEGLSVSYNYNSTSDTLSFLVKVANMSAHSTNPSADFGFKLPNGTDGSIGLGTAQGSGVSTMVHRTAGIYADDNGSAPSSYSYSTYPVRIYHNADNSEICNGCVDVFVDVTNNWIIYSMARTKVITDTEMGGNSATIELVSNVGSARGWNDNVVDGDSFTITK